MVELESQTPVGVRVLAWLTFAKALWVVYFFLVISAPWRLFLLLQGVICFVVGRGLLRLKRWAYYVTLLMILLIVLILVSLDIISNVPDTLLDIVIAVFVGEYPFYWMFLFSFAYGASGWVHDIISLFIPTIYVLILAYLLHPRIKRAFRISGFLR